MSDDLLKLYPVSTDREAVLENNELVHDNSRISTFLFATNWESVERKPMFAYFWTYRAANSPGGASHGSEVPFVFNNLDLDTAHQNWTDEDRKVADIMSSYWANFAKTGNPNGPGLPYWLAVDPKSPTVMELGEHFAPILIATPERLALWEQYLQTQKAW